MNQIGTSVGNRSIGNNSAMIHALSFSACGKALATGGDDCCVRIWDIAHTESVAASQPTTVVNGFNTHPVKTFRYSQNYADGSAIQQAKFAFLSWQVCESRFPVRMIFDRISFAACRYRT